jgi:hypothetical protein
VSAAMAAALRAHAAGLHPDEASTEPIISHGAISHHNDFARFIRTATSISDGTATMAWIAWNAVLSALQDGQLPLSGRERRILTLILSIAEGTPVSHRDAIPGLDNHNLELPITTIRHTAGQPGHR